MPEAVAPAGEAASALSLPAADQVAAPANNTERREAKQSAPARVRPIIAPALLSAMRREVDLIVYDVPLSELVARLGQSAEVGLSLSPQVAADTVRASADLRGLTLHEALSKLAEAAGLTIAPSGSSVLLRPRIDVGTTGPPAIWSVEWGTAPQTGFPPPPRLRRHGSFRTGAGERRIPFYRGATIQVPPPVGERRTGLEKVDFRPRPGPAGRRAACSGSASMLRRAGFTWNWSPAAWNPPFTSPRRPAMRDSSSSNRRDGSASCATASSCPRRSWISGASCGAAASAGR